MSTIKYAPLPVFIIDEEMNILAQSDEAAALFGEVQHFLEIVDEDSQNKARKRLGQKKKIKTELVMHSRKAKMSLYTVNCKWEQDKAHVICVEEDSQIRILSEKIQQHTARLSETDLELLLQKERLEKAMNRVIELSGPFIHLSNNMVLIPLFGDLFEEVIMKNEHRLLRQIDEETVDRVIIDFNGIGQIDERGVAALEHLIWEFQLMGVQIYLTGVTPDHSQWLHQYHFQANVKSISNLGQAIHQFFTTA